MALIDQTDVAAAIVANANPANPLGDGTGFIPQVAGAPYFIKFPAAAGLTYTVSTNVLPGDLVLLGPNGEPLNPGTGIKAMSFTVPANGLYFLAFTANPQIVAAQQEITIDITADNFGLTDPTFGGGLTPANQSMFNPFGGLAGAVLGFNSGPQGGAEHFQYYLHLPDGNATGLATAAPTSLVNTGVQLVNSPTQATITPLEMPPAGEVGDPTKPITWVGATDAPGKPGDPIQISISPAASNYAVDSNLHVGFDNLLSSQDLNLLVAAAHVWEFAANVHFNFLPDVPEGGTQQPADVRVGLADINKALNQPNMTFVGDTEYNWDANNKFLPDNLVNIEDPNETKTTQLSDGDQQYNGTTATMFQSMIHELGHTLGLDHNPNDPNSIMNPNLSSKNPFPDNNDVAALQSLYGAPTQSVTFASQADLTLFTNLVNTANGTPTT